jgi:hypothetical protein
MTALGSPENPALTEVEIVVLGIADDEQEADGVNDG